jgi:hypothetical protein
MRACAVLAALALATASSGCVSYVVYQRTKKQRVEPTWIVGSLVGEVGLGTLFGVGLHGVNENHPDDTQLGLPAWIGIGNLVMLALDGVSAAVIASSGPSVTIAMA